MTASPETATLLVSCPDRRGIVAALAQVLHGHGANILDSDQHTDSEAGIFFQRIRFDGSDLVTDRTSLSRAIVPTRRNGWRSSSPEPTTACTTCCCGTARASSGARSR
jgi:formyltetrahydrofolate hydrolase